MGPVRQNPIQRTVSLFICVCIALCTIVAHNIAQNRPDSFPPYPPDDHHSSDDVYLREGGPTKQNLYAQVHTEWPAYSQPTQSAEGILCLQFTVHSATTTMLFSSCYITYFTTRLAICISLLLLYFPHCLQCFDTVVWASGRASSIWKKLSDMSGTRFKWFAHGPADVTATQSSLAP